MNPKYAIVTTPNRDFNLLFPDPTKLRNSDHKFEWTRAEFHTWAGEVCQKYGYRVEFTGVGLHEARPDLGYCTQIAVFNRLNCLKPKEFLLSPFELVAEFDFPVKKLLHCPLELYFQLVYAYNTCIKWTEHDEDNYVNVKSLMNSAGFARFCDGTKHRALKLVMRTAKLYPDIEVLGDLMRVKTEEQSEEEEY